MIASFCLTATGAQFDYFTTQWPLKFEKLLASPSYFSLRIVK